MGRLATFLVLAMAVPAYYATLENLTTVRKHLPSGDEVNTVLPSPILKVTSLGFDGLVSDMLYLKALVFYGSSYENNKRRVMLPWEYAWIYRILDVSTDLDPYFNDPYLLANGVLPWEGKMVRETNTLLEKGCRFRDWDYWLQFYIGFNYFYFLNDSGKASEYLMKASKLPGADPFFGFFAARLAYAGNRTENAVMFLEGMVKTTREKTLRKDFETRLEALRSALTLERGVSDFKIRFGRVPSDLTELQTAGVLASIPRDPYGGKFYIDSEGAIRTTSDLRTTKNKN